MVILYSTGCPKCRVLKQKLDSKSIQYQEENSVDVMFSLGIREAPMLSVNGELMSFPKANEWVNAHGMKGSDKQRQSDEDYSTFSCEECLTR